MFEREQNILKQIEKAREAIRKKYMLLKYGKADAEKIRNESLKPIVSPLEKLVDATEFGKGSLTPKKEILLSKKESKESSSEEEEELNDTVKSIFHSDQSFSGNNTLKRDTTFETADSDSDEENTNDSYTDKYLLMLNQNRKRYLDNVFGVRKLDNNKLVIGDSPIQFEQDHIKVNDVRYPKTIGLLELLFRKEPDSKLISSKDIEDYRQIIETTNAHRRGYNKDEPIRNQRTKKFNTFIAPLIGFKRKSVSGSGFPPPYKIAKKNSHMDYVYWDDPNELVDRLRLLIAEKVAGNSSHINEIHSIVEELREAGYIN